MSRLVARILLSIFVFPLAGLCYTVVVVLIEDSSVGRSYPYQNRGVYAFSTAGLVTWLVVAAYWTLLWRSAVRWTGRRVTWTAAAAVVAAGVGAIVGSGLVALLSGIDGDFPFFVGGVLAILLWLVATVLLWRETAAERASRATADNASAVTCPNCGYNLTGLSEARCPECGRRYTLSELIAGQPATAGRLQ